MKKLLCGAILMSIFAMAMAKADEDPFTGDENSKCETKKGLEQKQKAFQQHKIADGLVERIKNKDPEKYEELKKLKESDPEKYREKIKELAKEMMQEFRGEREEIETLVAKFKKTGNEADKNALREKIKEQMLKRIAVGKEKIAATEEKLANLKAKIEETEKNIETKIDERIAKILEEKTNEKDQKQKQENKKDNSNKKDGKI